MITLSDEAMARRISAALSPDGVAVLDPELWPPPGVEPDWPQARVVLPSGTTLRADVASSAAERERGLRFRPESRFGPDQAMLFIFEGSDTHDIWTKDCSFPIDIVWLSRARRVVHVERDAPPCPAEPCPIYHPGEPALYVLALHRGTVARTGLRIGDRIGIERDEIPSER